MLNVLCPEYLARVRATATIAHRIEQLEQQLTYLASYACHTDPEHTRCDLYKDFAPLSFSFTMYRRESPDAGYQRWFNGGPIFHGPHDAGGSGEAPTFAVCLTPEDGWSIHT